MFSRKGCFLLGIMLSALPYGSQSSQMLLWFGCQIAIVFFENHKVLSSDKASIILLILFFIFFINKHWLGHCSPNFDGDYYLRLPKARFFSNKKSNNKSSLECSREVPKQLKIMYENETVPLLFWFATAVGALEVTCIFPSMIFLVYD